VLARDPDSAAAHSSLGLTQVMAWQWQSAWQNLARASELDSLDTELADWDTWALFMSGETQAARDQGADLTERAPVALFMLAQAHGYAGEHDAVQPLLDEAERANMYMCPYETAVAHLSRGDEAGRARAMDLLFEAASLRSNCLIFLREDARLAGRFGER
jgi:hypothetical protein